MVDSRGMHSTGPVTAARQRPHLCSRSLLSPAIRFGRMPRSEKAKLKAEILTCEQDPEDAETADLKSLAKRIYEAYLKNFNMNKVKARVILAGKASNNPVGVLAAASHLARGGFWAAG